MTAERHRAGRTPQSLDLRSSACDEFDSSIGPPWEKRCRTTVETRRRDACVSRGEKTADVEHAQAAANPGRIGCAFNVRPGPLLRACSGIV
jgi:hypothetical protein